MKTLIVEDDFASRTLLQRYLSGISKCDIAVNGNEAIEAFQIALDENEPYDLICLDIMMPDVDGHETLRTIRKIESEYGIGGFKSVKVIMTTALGDSQNIIGSFREGCEAYITKPIERKKLIYEIEKLSHLNKNILI